MVLPAPPPQADPTSRAIGRCQVANRWRPLGDAMVDHAPQRSGQGPANKERKEKREHKKAEKKEKERARHMHSVTTPVGALAEPQSRSRSRSIHSDRSMPMPAEHAQIPCDIFQRIGDAQHDVPAQAPADVDVDACSESTTAHVQYEVPTTVRSSMALVVAPLKFRSHFGRGYGSLVVWVGHIDDAAWRSCARCWAPEGPPLCRFAARSCSPRRLWSPGCRASQGRAAAWRRPLSPTSRVLWRRSSRRLSALAALGGGALAPRSRPR